ncbi:MAG: hypothetical protein K6V36_11390 [Anaerolineae bacterium]|nr:hypothetical protein [Anaerolineae bacterium]
MDRPGNREALAPEIKCVAALPASPGADSAGEAQPQAWAEPVDPEVLRHEAWARERHDLEMRTGALILELERALAELDGLLERYNEILARRAAFSPPIRTESPLPREFAGMVHSARERLQASRPDLFPA